MCLVNSGVSFCGGGNEFVVPGDTTVTTMVVVFFL